MFRLMFLRAPGRPLSGRLGLPCVGLFLLFAVCSAQAQSPGGRLDPAERARLRHELREQAWAQRSAELASRNPAWRDDSGASLRPAAGLPPAGAHPAGLHTGEMPPGDTPLADVHTAAASPGAGRTPEVRRGTWLADPAPHGGGYASEALPDRGYWRLSADERRHLRGQLREERQRRRERGELPGR